MTKKAKQAEAPVEKPVDPIVVKIVQAIRPGDVVFIECDEPRTTAQLTDLNKKIKDKLPDVRIVILNKGSRVSQVQTLATIAANAAASKSKS
jgi:hypothetical protein